MKFNVNTVKNISLVVLAISLIVSILYAVNLNHKYSQNLVTSQATTDSLCTVVSIEQNRYDSLKSYSDSVYAYELQKNDSLWQVLQSKQTTNKTKVTYIYKDSTIIKEAENTEIETQIETKYVTQVVEKEVIKTVHDTLYVAKTDSAFNENTTQTHKDEKTEEKTVVVKDDLFNIYLDGNVKANLDFDIVPEIGAGIIIKEKFYGQIGVDYSNSKVNPHAKIGIRWELF